MLKPERYRGLKRQLIKDTGTRLAYEDLCQIIEQLARDINSLPRGDTFPSGAIVFWLGDVSTIPAGWEEATELRQRFPRGMASGGTPGATGGASQHSHGADATATGGSTGSSLSIKEGTGATWSVATSPHNHYISVASHLPPYVDGIWIRKL